MLIRIDPNRSEPLFEQLLAQLREQIFQGQLKTGERLPSAKELAKELDINLHTVLHAYQLLREEGLIALKPGLGARVTAKVDPAPEQLDQLIESLVKLAKTHQLPNSYLLSRLETQLNKGGN